MKTFKATRIAGLFLAAAVMMALPLLGVALSGQRIEPCLTFPPGPGPAEHAGFSWPVFVGVGLLCLLAILPFDLWVLASRRWLPLPHAPPAGTLPTWGRLGVIGMAVAWGLAWTRLPWLAPLQPYTFLPLWGLYILAINGLTQMRTGRCMLTADPLRFLLLFPVSAAFWWFFEHLNRFTGNWYYVGTESIAEAGRTVIASLSFSTVLPAVLGTCELLASFPAAGHGLDRFVPIPVRRPRRLAVFALLGSCAALAGLPVARDFLFPFLWIAPLLVLTSIQSLRGEPTVFSGLRDGDWRRVYLLALSALVCGLFWEMWNYGSLVKWVYDVPFVGRFKLFEMPLLGYFGYLPFGLECAVISDFLQPRAPAVTGPDART